MRSEIGSYLLSALLLVLLTVAAGCGRTSDPPLDGDSGAVGCEQTTRESCYMGVAFAHCPGPQRPAVYCAGSNGGLPGSQGCVWVSSGCPLEQYKIELTADCTCKQCQAGHQMNMWLFMISFGTAPWSRTGLPSSKAMSAT